MKTPFDSIGKTYNHIVRWRQLIQILIKYGFADIVDVLNLQHYIEVGKSVVSRKPVKEINSITREERIRKVVEEMGTTFIKFGQILSTRPDLISQPLIKEFKKLQDKVAPFPDEQAIKIIEEELDGKAEELFLDFSGKPIASASIGQVYSGFLSGGEKVAIKVRRPDIEKIVKVDLEILTNLAKLGETHLSGLEIIQPVAIIEEFARQLDNEMNFLIEAYNIERFAKNAKKAKNIHAINVFRSHSTRIVLTTEFAEGTKIDSTKKLNKKKVDKSNIAVTVTNALLKQIFEDGFFHGDPHPGNVLVTEDQKVCFLDFGMMGSLSKKDQENFADLIVNVATNNEDEITNSVLKVSINSDEIKDIYKLNKEVLRFVNSYAYLPLNQLDAGKILQDLLDIIIKFGVRLPPEYYLLIKSIVTVEGIGNSLDPDFVFMDYVKPYAEKLIMRRYDPRKISKDIGKTSIEFYKLANDMPNEIREIIKFIKRGEIKIDLETKSLQPVMKTWDRDANRLAFAIVNASILLSSALIIMAKVPPMWQGVSVPGMIGFGLSGLMALRLLLAIISSGHM